MARAQPATTESLVVENIVCPHCKAVLDVSTDVCHHCGAKTTGQLMRPTASADRLIDRPWFLVIVLLHIGLLGIPLYWKTKYSFGVRLLLIFLSVAYTILAVLVIAWGISQIVAAVQALG
jgi:hypothetical protein